jgi:carbon storage regulator
MLILRRRAGEAILVGTDIEIEVLEISSQRATLGIRAPRAVPVLRKEISATAEENRAAARGVPLEALTGMFRRLRPAFPGKSLQAPGPPHR